MLFLESKGLLMVKTLVVNNSSKSFTIDLAVSGKGEVGNPASFEMKSGLTIAIERFCDSVATLKIGEKLKVGSSLEILSFAINFGIPHPYKISASRIMNNFFITKQVLKSKTRKHTGHICPII